MTWLILPGWGLPPKDYEKLADLLGPDTRTLDSWKVPLTADTDDIRAELGASDSQKVDLLGHSLGGLAAIEWALRRPGQVRQLVLIDPTAPDEVPSHFHVEGKLRRGMDKPPLRPYGAWGPRFADGESAKPPEAKTLFRSTRRVRVTGRGKTADAWPSSSQPAGSMPPGSKLCSTSAPTRSSGVAARRRCSLWARAAASSVDSCAASGIWGASCTLERSC